MIFHLVNGFNKIPKMWRRTTLEEDQINDIYRKLMDVDIFYTKIAEMMEDPLGKNRKCVILCIDGARLLIDKSYDFTFQKKTHYKNSK